MKASRAWTSFGRRRGRSIRRSRSRAENHDAISQKQGLVQIIGDEDDGGDGDALLHPARNIDGYARAKRASPTDDR
jgi:hypothetical protein